MSKCFFCNKETPKGIIRCKDCVNKNSTPTVLYRGKDWSCCESGERKKRYHKLTEG